MNNEFLKETVSFLSNQYSTENDNKAYYIIFNGRRFITLNNKSIWRKRSHAKSAFKCALSHLIKHKVKSYLLDNNLVENHWDVYKHPMFKDSWNNFIKYLEENNLFQIKELKEC